MIDPITIRCGFCRTTEDVTDETIGSRRDHLCGTCKRALYSIHENQAKDPDLTDDEILVRDGLAKLWLAVRDAQAKLDTTIQYRRTTAEEARQAELEAERAAAEQAQADAEEAAKGAAELADAEQALRDQEAAAHAKAVADAVAARDQALVDLSAGFVTLRDQLTKLNARLDAQAMTTSDKAG